MKKFFKRLKNSFKKRSERLFLLLPRASKKIVFCNFLGRGFADNPRYIAEALHKKRPDLDLVWLSTNPKKDAFPPYIRPVRMNSTRHIYEIATASALVTNVRNALSKHKRKGQIHLQTWHGCGAVKLVEKQIEHNLSLGYVADAKRDGQISDGILVGDAAQEKLFVESFWLAEHVEILRTGLPRIDPVLAHKNDTSYISDVRSRLGLTEDKFILYAPTFRDDGSLAGYDLDFDGIVKAFQEKDGNTWKILLRLHPNAASLAEKLKYSRNVVDVTAWPDINDLLLVSDVCITDYSSVMYESMLLEKPVFICMLDFEKYEQERGFVDDFFERPFYMSYDCATLLDQIKNFDADEYRARISEYARKNPSFDKGDASIQVADWLLRKMGLARSTML